MVQKEEFGTFKRISKLLFFFSHDNFLVTTVKDISKKIELLYVAFDPLVTFLTH